MLPDTGTGQCDAIVAEFKQALADTGLEGARGDDQPDFKHGDFTSNDRSLRRYALRWVIRNTDEASSRAPGGR